MRDQGTHDRGRALVELAATRLPQEHDVTGDANAWPFLGICLVSRMTTTLESILDLLPRAREVDAAILLRSLYEHAVHFAWMAADPTPARIEEWRKHDLKQRLIADDDARRHGFTMFTDEQRTAVEAQVAGMKGGKLVLADLAQAADGHWVGRLPGMEQEGQPASFRGLYAFLYRNYSGLSHPTYRGLNHVVDEVGAVRRRVRLEGPYENNGPYGIATIVYALGLYVASDAVGWPATSEINAIFDRFPRAEP